MRNHKFLSFALMLMAAPSILLAQATGTGNSTPPTSMPSAEQPKTPAVGTENNQAIKSHSSDMKDPAGNIGSHPNEGSQAH